MKNRFYIKHYAILFLIAFTNTIKAQQNPLFNTYSYDLMQLNIATIGRTCVEANVNYRAQWLGAKETPRLYQLNAGLALGNSNGIGIKIAQQSMGLLKITNATLGYAYRIKLNQKSKLHLGLGLAWQQNSFAANNASVIDNNDLSISNNSALQRSNNVDAEAGALYLGDKLTLGVSALHIYNANKKFDVTSYTSKPLVNVVLAYKFNKGKTVEIEPWLVNRYTVSGANQPEGLLNFKFKQLFTIGAGYRLNYGYLALAGFEVGKLKVAYSFDYAANNITKNLGSSHQILLGFDLCKNKKAKNTEPKKVQEPLYFTMNNGKSEGPYNMEKLKSLVKENKIQRETPIKSVETESVVNAEAMSELEPLFPPKVPMYYAKINGAEQGAYTMEQLQNLVKDGTIKRETPIRNQKETLSVDAEKVTELEPLFPPKEPMYMATMNGAEQGQFSMAQLQQMVKDGKIVRTTPIRNVNATTNTNADTYMQLEPLFPKESKCNVAILNDIAVKELQFGVGQTTLVGKYIHFKRIADMFKECPDLKVNIEGYASKDGNAAANKALSEKRADFVRKQLISLGVESSRVLGSKAFGSDKAVSTEDSQNRTVRFEIVK